MSASIGISSEEYAHRMFTRMPQLIYSDPEPNEQTGEHLSIFRMKVFKGWNVISIVKAYTFNVECQEWEYPINISHSSIFVADPEHEWHLEDIFEGKWNDT